MLKYLQINGPANTLNYIVRDVVPRMPKGYRYTLLDIGLVINQLMGHGYCSNYARRKFRSEYCASQEKFASQFPAKTNTVVSFEPNGQVKIPFFLLYTYIDISGNWKPLQHKAHHSKMLKDGWAKIHSIFCF